MEVRKGTFTNIRSGGDTFMARTETKKGDRSHSHIELTYEDEVLMNKETSTKRVRKDESNRSMDSDYIKIR